MIDLVLLPWFLLQSYFSWKVTVRWEKFLHATWPPTSAGLFHLRARTQHHSAAVTLYSHTATHKPTFNLHCDTDDGCTQVLRESTNKHLTPWSVGQEVRPWPMSVCMCVCVLMTPSYWSATLRDQDLRCEVLTLAWCRNHTTIITLSWRSGHTTRLFVLT